MQKVTLTIENPNESKTVTLENDLSVGRTSLARLVLDDAGLSRVNTTFFRDGDDVFIVDENSTNGTFVNGERLEREPRKLTTATKSASEAKHRFTSKSSAHRQPPSGSQKSESARRIKINRKNCKPQKIAHEKLFRSF